MSENTNNERSAAPVLQIAMRQEMRQHALKGRAALAPAKFDGTLPTYHQNLERALRHWVLARKWRDLSRDLEQMGPDAAASRKVFLHAN